MSGESGSNITMINVMFVDGTELNIEGVSFANVHGHVRTMSKGTTLTLLLKNNIMFIDKILWIREVK